MSQKNYANKVKESAYIFIPQKKHADRVKEDFEAMLKRLGESMEDEFITEWELINNNENEWATAQFTIQKLKRKQMFNFMNQPYVINIQFQCISDCYL